MPKGLSGTMVEERVYRGEWFLPGNGARRVPGTLTISAQNSLTLVLDGSLDIPLAQTEGEDVWDRDRDHDIILGEAVAGEKFTLINCVETSYQPRSRGATTQEFWANLGFSGVHFEGPDELRFSELIAHFSHLDEWYGVSGFKIRDSLRDGIVITYERPLEVSLGSVCGFDLAIRLMVEHPTRRFLQKEAKVSQEAVLVINAESGQAAFDDFGRMLWGFENFVCLATREVPHPISVRGRCDKAVHQIKDGDTIRAIPEDVTVFLPLSAAPTHARDVMPQHMLFHWKDIADQAQEFVQRWYEKWDRFRPAFDCFFAACYSKQPYMNQLFLSLARGLETYHRRARPELDRRTERHRARLKGTLKNTSFHFLLTRADSDDVFQRNHGPMSCPVCRSSAALAVRSEACRATAVRQATPYPPGGAKSA